MSRRTAVVAILVALVAAAFIGPPGRADAAHPDWDEWDLLRLINQERWQRGIAPLSMAPALRDASRTWTNVMVSEGTLRHDPNIGTVIERLVPDWRRYGENVGRGGGNSTVPILHKAFMDSEHHRDNILNAAFTTAGVGAAWSGRELWVTVRFLTSASPIPLLTRTPVTRIAGADDVATAVNLSQRRGTASADSVVVARNDGFADALAGGPLASVGNGPLLLSPTTAAPAAVVGEARRVLRAGGVVRLLGGTAALSPAVEAAFAAAGLRTERLAGADRFETAAAVANAVDPTPGTVFLASGVNFPDALAASAPAGTLRAPILLVAPDRVPAPTAELLAAARPATRVVVGGPAAVGDATAAAAGGTERVAGADRFATAAAIVARFSPASVRPVLATGLRYQDALVAGPEAARIGGFVMLTAAGTPPATYQTIAAVNPKWAEAIVVGTAIPANDISLLFT